MLLSVIICLSVYIADSLFAAWQHDPCSNVPVRTHDHTYMHNPRRLSSNYSLNADTKLRFGEGDGCTASVIQICNDVQTIMMGNMVQVSFDRTFFDKTRACN